MFDQREKTLEFRQLRYFIAVSEVRNINKAAELCFVTQPALTQQIRKLENELCTSLLIRSGRGITLTREGERLSRYAKELIQKSDAIKKEFTGGERPGESTLTLAIEPDIPAFVEDLARTQFAGERVRFRKMDIRKIEREMSRKMISGGIVSEKMVTRGLGSRKFATESFSVVCSEHAVLSGRHVKSMQSIQAMPFALLTDSHSWRKCLDRYVEAWGTPLDIVVEVDSVESLVNVLKYSSLVTLLPKSVASGLNIPGLRAIDILNDAPGRTFYYSFLLDRDQQTTTVAMGDCRSGIPAT